MLLLPYWTMLCCRLCLTYAEEKKPGIWKEVAQHPLPSAAPDGPATAAQEEHLLLLRNAIAAGLLLDTCTCLVVAV